MAKQTKKSAEPTAPADPNAPAAPPKGENDKFARVFIDAPNGGRVAAPALKVDGTAQRLAPQLLAIANVLEAVGEEGISRKDLVEKLSAPGVLTTRQPVGRILSYYQKDLVNFGLATRTPGA